MVDDIKDVRLYYFEHCNYIAFYDERILFNKVQESIIFSKARESWKFYFHKFFELSFFNVYFTNAHSFEHYFFCYVLSAYFLFCFFPTNHTYVPCFATVLLITLLRNFRLIVQLMNIITFICNLEFIFPSLKRQKMIQR